MVRREGKRDGEWSKEEKEGERERGADETLHGTHPSFWRKLTMGEMRRQSRRD